MSWGFHALYAGVAQVGWHGGEVGGRPQTEGRWLPAQSGQRPAPGLPLVGEQQTQEANERETTEIRSQQIFIRRLLSYWEEAMMLDTPVGKRRGERSIRQEWETNLQPPARAPTIL